MISASVEIQVPFHDVDMMNVVWHGHYAKYLEIARCALLDKIEYNYNEMKASGYAWPVIDLHIRYPGPACFGETVSVTATLAEWVDRLHIRYEIRNASGKRITRATTTMVAVDMSTQSMCYESPQILIDKVEAHL
ncbi:acyl-CoA thioesterase [Oceanobacter mangrovi]|uniref:acyl-CoA thioesterase n=1 Tax=Oceanobacter mangrovi TaxID=2862510 RepID=UPI001FE30611|nr:acyl-CoA thioesterase [Oceanobacter mangrovi]